MLVVVALSPDDLEELSDGEAEAFWAQLPMRIGEACE
jgi:hypothetical protein